MLITTHADQNGTEWCKEQGGVARARLLETAKRGPDCCNQARRSVTARPSSWPRASPASSAFSLLPHAWPLFPSTSSGCSGPRDSCVCCAARAVGGGCGGSGVSEAGRRPGWAGTMDGTSIYVPQCTTYSCPPPPAHSTAQPSLPPPCHAAAASTPLAIRAALPLPHMCAQGRHAQAAHNPAHIHSIPPLPLHRAHPHPCAPPHTHRQLLCCQLALVVVVFRPLPHHLCMPPPVLLQLRGCRLVPHGV